MAWRAEISWGLGDHAALHDQAWLAGAHCMGPPATPGRVQLKMPSVRVTELGSRTKTKSFNDYLVSEDEMFQ